MTKAFEVMKYLLKMSDSTSLIWSAHVKLLFQLYNLPDPLTLLSTPPWPKQRWRDHTKTAVTSYHEAFWRLSAAQNSKLQFLNVQAIGLSAKPHPVVSWAVTTQDVITIRTHMKMLSGDYLCYSYLAHDRGLDPCCRLCQILPQSEQVTQTPTEDMVHIIAECRATRETRDQSLPNLLNIVADYFPSNMVLTNPTSRQLTQFILDCSSLNLPSNFRIPFDHPGFVQITRSCSNFIFAIHKLRVRQLKAMGYITN